MPDIVKTTEKTKFAEKKKENQPKPAKEIEEEETDQTGSNHDHHDHDEHDHHDHSEEQEENSKPKGKFMHLGLYHYGLLARYEKSSFPNFENPRFSRPQTTAEI